MSASSGYGVSLTLTIGAHLVTCLLSMSTSSKEGSDYAGYGVLIDGGSSSSKLKIYGWKPPTLQKRVPTIDLISSSPHINGVQIFYSQWDNLTGYMQNILNDAMKGVPEKMHSNTPIYMMATAGVRSLTLKETTILLDQIRERLAKSVFSYHPARVEVLSGEEEGVYSWIAANYLLGFFDSDKPHNQSVGILEMGGGSMQITFIPRDPMYAEEFQVTIAGTRYQLYAQSYMKYGANAIKERIADLIASNTSGGSNLNNPCMLKGDLTSIKLESGTTYTMVGTSSGSQCQELLENILRPNQGYGCEPKPCAIGSVHQPSVADISFYATQAFTHTPKVLKALGENDVLHLDVLKQAAMTHCSLPLDEVQDNKKYASDTCLMGLYMPTLFTKSYGFSNTTKNIKSTSKVGNQTIDWSLGVMLVELSSKFTLNSSGYSVTCPPGILQGQNSSTISSYPSMSIIVVCHMMYSIFNVPVSLYTT